MGVQEVRREVVLGLRGLLGLELQRLLGSRGLRGFGGERRCSVART